MKRSKMAGIGFLAVAALLGAARFSVACEDLGDCEGADLTFCSEDDFALIASAGGFFATTYLGEGNVPTGCNDPFVINLISQLPGVALNSGGGGGGGSSQAGSDPNGPSCENYCENETCSNAQCVDGCGYYINGASSDPENCASFSTQNQRTCAKSGANINNGCTCDSPAIDMGASCVCQNGGDPTNSCQCVGGWVTDQFGNCVPPNNPINPGQCLGSACGGTTGGGTLSGGGSSGGGSITGLKSVAGYGAVIPIDLGLFAYIVQLAQAGLKAGRSVEYVAEQIANALENMAGTDIAAFTTQHWQTVLGYLETVVSAVSIGTNPSLLLQGDPCATSVPYSNGWYRLGCGNTMN